MKNKISFLILIFLLQFFIAVSAYASYVFESFDSDNVFNGFFSDKKWSISEGMYHYNDVDTEEGNIDWTVWSGGENPGGSFPLPLNSNYFYDFVVSVTASYKQGEPDNGYGMYVCGNKNKNGENQGVIFIINKNGNYQVNDIIDGDWRISTIGRIKTDIIKGQNDIVTVVKQGDYFRFFINYNEVELIKIDGHKGGSVGVASESGVQASFDNFEVLDLSQFQANYNSNTNRIDMPIVDVIYASDNLEKFQISMNMFYNAEQLFLGLYDVDLYSNDTQISWYNILDKINIQAYIPNFSFSNNILNIPALSIQSKKEYVDIYKADLKLSTVYGNSAFALNNFDTIQLIAL